MAVRCIVYVLWTKICRFPWVLVNGKMYGYCRHGMHWKGGSSKWSSNESDVRKELNRPRRIRRCLLQRCLQLKPCKVGLLKLRCAWIEWRKPHCLSSWAKNRHWRIHQIESFSKWKHTDVPHVYSLLPKMFLRSSMAHMDMQWRSGESLSNGVMVTVRGLWPSRFWLWCGHSYSVTTRYDVVLS